jgi:hypothetical protein
VRAEWEDETESVTDSDGRNPYTFSLSGLSAEFKIFTRDPCTICASSTEQPQAVDYSESPSAQKNTSEDLFTLHTADREWYQPINIYSGGGG